MKFFFLGSPKPSVVAELEALKAIYGQSRFEEADCIIAVGGDGVVLKALHTAISDGSKPVFAMRGEGSYGFLGNTLKRENLLDRVRGALSVSLYPLRVETEFADSSKATAYAINEVSLIRQTRQSSWLSIAINGIERAAKIVGDGVIVSTPVGSTAYNRSAGGPILPLDSRLLTITGLATFPGAEWSNAVVHNTAQIKIEVLDPIHRPVKLETDISDFCDVKRLVVSSSLDRKLTLLFDPKSSLDSDRISTPLERKWISG